MQEQNNALTQNINKQHNLHKKYCNFNKLSADRSSLSKVPRFFQSGERVHDINFWKLELEKEARLNLAETGELKVSDKDAEMFLIRVILECMIL